MKTKEYWLDIYRNFDLPTLKEELKSLQRIHSDEKIENAIEVLKELIIKREVEG